MTPEQKAELEQDLLFFVKRVCRQENPMKQSPEEVNALPGVVTALVGLDIASGGMGKMSAAMPEKIDMEVPCDKMLVFGSMEEALGSARSRLKGFGI